MSCGMMCEGLSRCAIMGIKLILSELFLSKRIWSTVHLTCFDLLKSVRRRKQRLGL